MPIINRAVLDAANRSFHTIFNDAFANAPDNYSDVSMIVESNTTQEDYAWLGEIPTVKQWVSDRTFASLKAYDFSIKNLPWEMGIEVLRDDIEDDKLGMVPPRIRDLATKAKLHYSKLIWLLATGGFAALAYDGQYFFDTDHGDAGNISNKITGALSAANFDDAMQKFMQIKDDQGRDYLDITPTHLVVPPALRATAKLILENEYLANGGSNYNFGAVKLVVEPRLAAHPTKWFLLDLSKEIKPFILQIRRPFQFVAQDNPEVHEQAFLRRVYRYGVDARHNAGYGMWQLAFGSDGTT